MTRGARYPAELRERAVRLVQEHAGEYASQWAALTSIATKCGMTPETLRKWVRRAEVDAGGRPGLTTDERQRLKDLSAAVDKVRGKYGFGAVTPGSVLRARRRDH